MTEPDHKKNRRILIIDDNRAIHDDFRKILSPGTVAAAALEVTEAQLFGKPANAVQKIQCEIDSAYQGQEGVALVKQALAAGRPYAMAFVDIRMPPGMDGVETTQKIWAVDPEVQIVVCTAYADYSWDEMFEKIGNSAAVVILKKPFDAVEALQLAHALTEKWWLHQQAMLKMQELEVRVTERTAELAKTNETLRESEQRFASAFEFASIGMALVVPIGMMPVAPAGRWLKVNRALCELVGYTEAELLTRTFHNITHPEDREVGLEKMRRLIAGEIRTYQIEKRYIHKRGHYVTVLINASLVRDWQDEPLYLISQIQDITERRQAEAELNYERELLRTLMAHSPDKIYFKDVQSRFIKASQAQARQFGVASPDELVGRTDFDFFTEAHARPAFEDEQEIIRTGRPMIDKEEEETWKDGHVTWAASSKIPWLDVAGNIVGILGISRDITARKKLEAQLFQSQKMETVGKLAGGVAHEFNSILTAIIGQSELLLADLPGESPLIQNVTEISKAANRAATLTRQLLAYGRKQFLQPEALDLNRVVAGMDAMFRNLMGGEVSTHFVPATGLRAVKADAGQIEQVIMNLVINAREAMPNGGKLTLETANVSFDEESVGRYPELKPGDYVMLAITDTGTGMSEDVRARVFEPFFSTKGVGQGTGLGLATCYGIVKQSGGHISAYSELGRGATFKIYLPQMEQKKIPIQRPGSPDLPRGTETVLLVEDDPALRDMAAMLLRRLGYTVLTAANGVEALSLKQQRGVGHIDLLFTDVVMPHMSGKELADRVRSLYPHTKILFTSAYTENAIVHQGVLNKGVTLLQKPFTPSALAHKLREVLDAPVVG